MFSPEPTTHIASDPNWQGSLRLLSCDQLPQQADPQPPCDSGPRGSKRKQHDPPREDSSRQTEKGNKKQRSDFQFSCPYRRRNPRLFNVRDFHACANRSFSDMSLVKRHVMKNHQSKDFTLQCSTCKAWFRKQAFDYHSMNRRCSSLPSPALDKYDKGITQDMEVKLRDRRAKTQVLTWEDLWRTIFPGDSNIETPDFEPILEHNEAKELFYRGLPDHNYNAMFQLRDVASDSDALDAAPLQVQGFPVLALEPAIANFQYPYCGPDMGLQNDLSSSRAPENHP